MLTALAGLAAVLAMLPAALWPLRRPDAVRGRIFWILLVVAVLGPLVYVATHLEWPWRGGLALNLWVSIAASAILYFGLCLFIRVATGLAPLLLGYLVVLGLVAVGGEAIAGPHPAYRISSLLLVHIVLAVGAYALATIAAVAGAAVVIKQRAIKRKRSGPLSRSLPAVAVSDLFQVWLLAMAGGVLGVDIMAGMATEYALSGVLMQIEHKTLLSLLAFAVILGLVVLHAGAGLRGRVAARGVLIGYLLLTLGYPGVKFVTDVVMA